MDQYGDHGLVCPCKGDRTRRHHLVRDIVWQEARRAGFVAERERPGLLSGVADPDDGCADARNARRPADVWLQGEGGGADRALDLAVTSGMTTRWLARPGTTAADVLNDYAARKAAAMDTAAACAARGLRFVPVILEAHGGGWGDHLRGFVDELAGRQKAREPGADSPASLRIAQRISIGLIAESSRAVLRRLGGPSDAEDADGVLADPGVALPPE